MPAHLPVTPSHILLTFALQCLSTPLLLATGLVSRSVAAQPRVDEPFHRAGWRVVGVMFVVFGVDLFIGNVLQARAIYGSNLPPALRLYYGLAPMLDHSRTFLALGGLAALVILALRREVPGPRFWRLAWALLGIGLLVGVMIGYVEGGKPFTIRGHLFVVVLWDVVELLAILSSLFVLLVTNRADRALWALLAAYACSLALGIPWLSVLTNFGQGWNPPAWTTHAVRDFFYTAMLAAAVYRLLSARRGRRMDGMMGRKPAQLSMIR